MLTRWKRIKLRMAMRFARVLGVPVDVHSSYFTGRTAHAAIFREGAGDIAGHRD